MHWTESFILQDPPQSSPSSGNQGSPRRSIRGRLLAARVATWLSQASPLRLDERWQQAPFDGGEVAGVVVLGLDVLAR